MCNKTFKQKFSFYDDKLFISKEVVHIIKNMLIDRISMEYAGKYPYVISNLFNTKLIDIIKSRRKDYTNFFINKYYNSAIKILSKSVKLLIIVITK